MSKYNTRIYISIYKSNIPHRDSVLNNDSGRQSGWV